MILSNTYPAAKTASMKPVPSYRTSSHFGIKYPIDLIPIDKNSEPFKGLLPKLINRDTHFYTGSKDLFLGFKVLHESIYVGFVVGEHERDHELARIRKDQKGKPEVELFYKKNIQADAADKIKSFILNYIQQN